MAETGLYTPTPARDASLVATVVHGDFEWDREKAARNLTKHGVSFEEACTVFEDPYAVDAPDIEIPRRFALIGMSRALRVLFVIVGESTGVRIRLISARPASPSQRKLYEAKT